MSDTEQVESPPIKLQRRPRPPLPVIDTANEPETIGLAKALRSALRAGFSQKGIARVPHEEKVGKFLKQYDPQSVSSAVIKANADNISTMLETCETELAKIEGNTEADNNLKLQWHKLKATYVKLLHLSALDYHKIAHRELAVREPEKPRTPSFPANTNVSAPVMAQQVNVIVHQAKEE